MPHALPCAMEFGFLAKVFKIGILKESASEHLLKEMKRHCDKKQKNVMIQTKHCDGWFESSHCFKSIIAMFFRYQTVLFYVRLLYLIQILKPISIQYLTLFAEEYFGIYSIFVYQYHLIDFSSLLVGLYRSFSERAACKVFLNYKLYYCRKFSDFYRLTIAKNISLRLRAYHLNTCHSFRRNIATCK